MSGVSAILLAAGESRRMGGINKLTMPVNGIPLLRRSAAMLCNSALREVVAVVGHEEQTARQLLAGLPLTVVSNERYREGQMTSVYRGMKALSEPYDGVMICLSDQPLLEIVDIDRLIHAFISDGETSILVPTYKGRRGNPIILAYRHRKNILDGHRNLGCRQLIENNPELVTPLEMDNDHVVFDLDTPEDYERLQHRYDCMLDAA